MIYIAGFVAVATVVYWGFIRKESDTEEETIKKIARTAVILFIVAIIAIIYLINK